MADARALLRAKRQEAKVTHPYAAYSSTGQLRCTVCGTPVKQASMWEGHLGSKSHRVAVMKMREQEEKERRRAEEATAATTKRKAAEEDDGDTDEDMHVDAKKRRLSDEENDEQPPTVKTKAQAANGFPADFFSNPSQAPVLSGVDEEEDEAADSIQAQAPGPAKEKTQIDLEWEQFQATVLKKAVSEEQADDELQAAFQRATVIAEPELVPEAAAGFPPSVVDGEGAAEAEQGEDLEEDKQRRKEQDERELIMDRLIEEERAQEEADERVGLMKAKVEALKRMREAKKKAKVKS